MVDVLINQRVKEHHKSIRNQNVFACCMKKSYFVLIYQNLTLNWFFSLSKKKNLPLSFIIYISNEFMYCELCLQWQFLVNFFNTHKAKTSSIREAIRSKCCILRDKVNL